MREKELGADLGFTTSTAAMWPLSSRSTAIVEQAATHVTSCTRRTLPARLTRWVIFHPTPAGWDILQKISI
jgi:hypothetical protein